MIPQEHKSTVAQWIAHEASLLGEEVIWQNEWQGVYRAKRKVGGMMFEFVFVAYGSDPT